MRGVLLILICAGIFGYQFFKDRYAVSGASVPTHAEESAPTQQYRCDGRTRCAQMTSCEEARFFLDNCPGTAMDGDNDGIPCEGQWCR